MNKFNSKMFFEDEFFNDLYTYKTINGEEYTINVIINQTIDNTMGGNIKKFIADFADILIWKSDIGFEPVVHDKLIAGNIIYDIITIRDDGDCYSLNAKKNVRVGK